MKEYGESMNNPNLVLNAAWKLEDWKSVKNAFNLSSVVALAEIQLPDIQLMLYQIYAAIHEGRTKDVEKLNRQANQFILSTWQSLPSPLLSCSNKHVELLSMFQNIIELEESVKIMKDITMQTKKVLNPLANNAAFNFSLETIMSTWRNRLPNEWDTPSVWIDVLIWRSHMYKFVNQTFTSINQSIKKSNSSSSSSSSSSPLDKKMKITTPLLNLSKLHDTQWTLIKLSSIVTSNTNNELSQHLINTLMQDTNATKKMVPAYQFQKMKNEMISKMNLPSELPKMISNINAIDLTTFEKWQRAELYVMKGKILEKMGLLSDSMKSYSAALSMDNNNDSAFSKLWIEWGQFYDRQLYNATKGTYSKNEQNEHCLGSCLSNAEGAKGAKGNEGDKGDGEIKKSLIIDYASSAMSTYLHALHCDSSPQTRLMLVRVLRLLRLAEDDQGGSKILDTFSTHVQATPSWCWIIWIPQLLQSLCRKESLIIFSILYKLCHLYPSSVYYSLRCYLLEQRGLKEKKTTTNGANGAKKGKKGKKGKKKQSYEYAEELMAYLRTTHSILAHETEIILNELITTFKPGPVEELLSAVLVLQEKLFQMCPEKISFSNFPS